MVDSEVASDLRKLPSTKRKHLPSNPEDDQVDLTKHGKPVRKPVHRLRFRNVLSSHATTILDSDEWLTNPAIGFWFLFWVVMGVYAVDIMVLNYWSNGTAFESNILLLMKRDICRVAIIDTVLYLSAYFTFFLQVLVKYNLISWNKVGWIVQHAYQTWYLFFFIGIARFQALTWISQIFLVLHSLTFIMKQHSYAMYNAHLHSITNELRSCKEWNTDSLRSETAAEVKERISFCTEELDLQSTKIRYPDNINLKNFFMYTMYPTVVYQLEFPRTPRVRWSFVFSKLLATFGILLILIVITQQSLYPATIEALELRELPIVRRLKHYPWLLFSVLPTLITSYILVFYLIWDAVLNCVAELSCYGDREFYRDWWNSTSWEKFARDWNVPVHQFLHRHVYHSSIASLKLNRVQATFLTFLLSACVHELAMFVIFDRLRGYLFLMQLSQLPLEYLCRTKFMRERPLLGLTVFWFGICTGPSILCSLYLIV